MNKLILLVCLGVVLFGSGGAQRQWNGKSYWPDNAKYRSIQTTLLPEGAPPRTVVIRAVSVQGSEVGFTNTTEVDAVTFLGSVDNQCSLGVSYLASRFPSVTKEKLFSPLSESNTTGHLNLNEFMSMAQVQLYLRMFVLFEWVDVDDEPGYTPGVDEMSGFYSLAHASWEPIVVQEETHSVYIDNVRREYKSATVSMITKDGVFAIRATMTGAPALVDTASLTPDMMKFDVFVNWFDNPKHVAGEHASGPSSREEARLGLLAAIIGNKGSRLKQSGEDAFDADSAGPGAVHLNSTEYGYGARMHWHRIVDVSTPDGRFSARPVWSHVVDPYKLSTALPPNFETAVNKVKQEALQLNHTATLAFFSFDSVRARDVVWDPELIVDVQYDNVINNEVEEPSEVTATASSSPYIATAAQKPPSRSEAAVRSSHALGTVLLATIVALFLL